MKSVLLSIAVLLIFLLALLGYYEFFAPTAYQESSFGDQSGWSMETYTGKSRLLGRLSLHIVVISKAQFPASCDGHRVTVNGQTMKGRRKVYLIDERGRMTESEAPVFRDLWENSRDIPGFKPARGDIETTSFPLRDSMGKWFPSAQ